jgi:YVTN family beta-propeller protein
MRRAIGGGRCGAIAVACMLALSGCGSPMPFRPAPRANAPVFGFGGSAPYVSLAPAAAPADVYSYTKPGMLSPAVRGIPPRIYVADAAGTTVEIIDPRTYRVAGHVRVGRRPRFVVPSWDLKTLWAGDDNGLVPIDPRSGRRGRAKRLAAPGNLTFTPNGRYALVMAERRIDVRDPHTLRLRRSIPLPCPSLGQADFAADGSYLVAGCAATGQLIRVDLHQATFTQTLRLTPPALPQDIKISPDGTLFYVSDTANAGVWVIDAERFWPTGFVPTGAGAYGLVPSRDGTLLYVTNRTEGTISLLDLATRRVIRYWRLPAGTSPGAGGVSADGTILWLSGDLHGVIYAISTSTGRLIHTIRAGDAPRVVCVFPQPGRHSLGPTYR